MADEIWQLPATTLAARFRDGTLRPSEALEAVLSRVAVANPVVNAFAQLDEGGARVAAEQSDARHAEGKPLGRLDGVPVSIKDNIPVQGLRCAWGSALYKDYVAPVDETPVARLRAQGAVILGKTNVSEFTLGRGNVHTPLFGTTRNPYDPRLTAGASTGGGAAAVSSGMGPLTLGTDGGGSIRRPACHCGLLGLKPTTGRVARRNGLPIILHDAEIIGPIARTVDDLALALAAIQGPLDEDRASLSFRADEGEPAEPKGLRILYMPRMADYQVDAPVAESCAKAARDLAALGHTVEEGPAPFDPQLFEKHWPNIGAAGLAWLVRGQEWRGKVGDIYVEMIEKGETLSAADYIEALAAFREIYAQMAVFFRSYDLLMTPSAGALPWTAEEFGKPYHRAFTGFVNAAGLPGISIPCDPSPEGLPIGFQLVAPFGADWLLVAMARQFERAHPWAQRWPSL
ncbi:amidase [Roseomonas sp. OT10]|uniref:amidase n=1 Tax=Roseomonas cutis TaxID=2897332 RepID=UPI001E603D42|nr:amidase [Roseomonas sp. OT10]UFN50552.1 amidase [Roseomonas sp. OT10]